ncbi:transporter substrate-binding domain-containing protein [Auraticoccus monumenti]|uniref:Extracellular solute-binding protein, family 3 n=1 Tax=Auraticoccus monumenti TaxID=675864 RepID=A0A1G7BTY7_9ACTN|nr:transporter substrate-binding domain-containing protein [Auraticoccus monumenti]SDE30467.1 extracellular solute-binding protein, family 3 [Auraticoccus monumenti]
MTKVTRMLAVLAVLVLTGCGARFPADPEDTLERVQGGELRVGAVVNPPFVVAEDPAEPTGSEADLVRGFADAQGARVVWEVGGESTLVRQLERGELDVVVGGLTSTTPWTEEAATTRPYGTFEEAGEEHELVLLTRLGENAFLVELETFLHQETGR